MQKKVQDYQKKNILFTIFFDLWDAKIFKMVYCSRNKLLCTKKTSMSAKKWYSTLH